MIHVELNEIGREIIHRCAPNASVARLQTIGRPVDLGRGHSLHRLNVVDARTGVTLVDDAAHLVIDACGGFELFENSDDEPTSVSRGHLLDFAH